MRKKKTIIKDDLWDYRKSLLKKGRKYIVINILLIMTLIFILIFPKLNLLTTNQYEFYSSRIFPYVALLGNALSSIFLFSITEALVLVGSVLLIVLVVLFIVKLCKAERKIGMKRYLIRRAICVLLIISNILSLDFMLMHGLNYKRRTAAYNLNIRGSYQGYYDYLEALTWAYNGMITARMELGEDYNGVAHMLTSFNDSVTDANELLDNFDYTYGLGLSPNRILCKPVMLSHYWSYTGIIGMYDVFIGETILNTDYMSVTEFPKTLLHELAHARGYARENDANAISTLALIHATRADFRYCGYLEIFGNLYYETCRYAESVGLEQPTIVTSEYQAVIRDIEANNSYWASINDEVTSNPIYEFVQTFSNDANNAYLEANGQVGGVDTYNVSPNVYVDFYCIYVRDRLNADS